MEALFWLGFFIVCLLAEIATVGLVSIWFAAGALVALLLAALNVSIAFQVVAFVAVSVLMIVVLRPIAQKHINAKAVKTNVDSLAGSTVRIIETIDNDAGTGRASVNGLEWMARTEDGAVLAEGSMATVLRVEGVKLIVKEKE